MSAETINCSECGSKNGAVSHFCLACGAPLWAPQEDDTTTTLPAEALELWKNATDEWKTALKTGEPDIFLWGHIASLLSLAVSNAGSVPFPRAHAHLAIVLLTLGMDDGAEREANIALEQDPNEFRAQQVRVALCLNGDNIRENDRASSPAFLHLGEWGLGDTTGGEPDGSAGNDGSSLIEAESAQSQSSTTISNLQTETERMLAIFRNFCDTNTDADEYLNIADFLILLGDQIQEMRLDLRSELYSAVAYTPTDKLNCQGRERQVVEVLQRARRGQHLLENAIAKRPARWRASFPSNSPLSLNSASCR